MADSTITEEKSGMLHADGNDGEKESSSVDLEEARHDDPIPSAEDVEEEDEKPQQHVADRREGFRFMWTLRLILCFCIGLVGCRIVLAAVSLYPGRHRAGTTYAPGPTSPTTVHHTIWRHRIPADKAFIFEMEAELERLESDQEDTASIPPRTLNASKACLAGIIQWESSTRCNLRFTEDELEQMLHDPDPGLRTSFCDETCRGGSWLSGCRPRADLTQKVTDFIAQSVSHRERRSTYCKAIAPAAEHDDCGKALVGMNRTDWAFTLRDFNQDFMSQVDQALEELLETQWAVDAAAASAAAATAATADPAPTLEQRQEYPDLRAKAQKPLLGETPSQQQQQRQRQQQQQQQKQKQLGATICAGCFWRQVAGARMREARTFIAIAPSAAEYVEFVKRYHAACTSLGADWLGDVPYGDDPLLWRVQTPSGDVMRYVDSDEWDEAWMPAGRIYALNEATRQVTWREKSANRASSLWEVLLAERTLRYVREDRWDEWRREIECRRLADAEFWEQVGGKHLVKHRGQDAVIMLMANGRQVRE
ncbi:hypothetical protein M406DRAFT_333620 [Cryphonectria parasitica EP155]|uniref:Uncharacterized protein n=1 Tax=Cryphonectria parasitica (strain ATCC 38755 / EP155) TaxID=660469 RepID=A0A9P4XVJ3_CRYP1|nr:uncharacterized protein M406DRAFT_333620 [Cryphonectria parasitica EP155]KAF3761560.1 hypothetical protein M406DRAFT_333620 [Cryphonectria parasitica EP155]